MTTPEELRIDLKPEVKAILRFIFSLQGLIIFAILPLLLWLAIGAMNDFPLLSVFIVVVALFFLRIGLRYLDNVFYKEYILVRQDTITVVYKGFWKTKEHVFPVEKILYFGFAGQEAYTPHPMENKVIDFTGLATVEREVQFLISDGTIELESETQVLRFGKNIPSWEAEEMIEAAETFLGIRFKNKYATNPLIN